MPGLDALGLAPAEIIGTPCIEVAGMSKRFWVERDRPATVSGFFVNKFRRQRQKSRHLFTALQDISFRLESGQTVGVIGANGSGKSTLLKLIAGIYLPTVGTVVVRQRLVALSELGAGFHGELTGREK